MGKMSIRFEQTLYGLPNLTMNLEIVISFFRFNTTGASESVLGLVETALTSQPTICAGISIFLVVTKKKCLPRRLGHEQDTDTKDKSPENANSNDNSP